MTTHPKTKSLNINGKNYIFWVIETDIIGMATKDKQITQIEIGMLKSVKQTKEDFSPFFNYPPERSNGLIPFYIQAPLTQEPDGSISSGTKWNLLLKEKLCWSFVELYRSLLGVKEVYGEVTPFDFIPNLSAHRNVKDSFFVDLASSIISQLGLYNSVPVSSHPGSKDIEWCLPGECYILEEKFYQILMNSPALSPLPLFSSPLVPMDFKRYFSLFEAIGVLPVPPQQYIHFLHSHKEWIRTLKFQAVFDLFSFVKEYLPNHTKAIQGIPLLPVVVAGEATFSCSTEEEPVFVLDTTTTKKEWNLLENMKKHTKCKLLQPPFFQIFFKQKEFLYWIVSNFNLKPIKMREVVSFWSRVPSKSSVLELTQQLFNLWKENNNIQKEIPKQLPVILKNERIYVIDKEECSLLPSDPKASWRQLIEEDGDLVVSSDYLQFEKEKEWESFGKCVLKICDVPFYVPQAKVSLRDSKELNIPLLLEWLNQLIDHPHLPTTILHPLKTVPWLPTKQGCMIPSMGFAQNLSTSLLNCNLPVATLPIPTNIAHYFQITSELNGDSLLIYLNNLKSFPPSKELLNIVSTVYSLISMENISVNNTSDYPVLLGNPRLRWTKISECCWNGNENIVPQLHVLSKEPKYSNLKNLFLNVFKVQEFPVVQYLRKWNEISNGQDSLNVHLKKDLWEQIEDFYERDIISVDLCKQYLHQNIKILSFKGTLCDINDLYYDDLNIEMSSKMALECCYHSNKKQMKLYDHLNINKLSSLISNKNIQKSIITAIEKQTETIHIEKLKDQVQKALQQHTSTEIQLPPEYKTDFSVIKEMEEWQSRNIPKICQIVDEVIHSNPKIEITKDLDSEFLNHPPLKEKFKNLISVAFLHSSYSTTFTQNQQLRKLLKSTDTSYERLEFLGDTILEMIVTEYLFAANPSADEGFLTQRRISLVSNSVCSSVSTFLGLPSFILHRVSSLSLKMKADVFESTLAALYMTFGKELTSHFLIHSFMLFANSSTPTIN